MIQIDTHAHIFRANESAAKVVRYVPNYDASANDYRKNLKDFNFTHGVLIQPSFLGTDNSYIFSAINEFDNLRAVAVINPNEYEVLIPQINKICGIRLNLIGKDKPDFTSNEWQECLKFLKQNNLHVEIHKELDLIEPIIKELYEMNAKIVIDHLARPSKTNANLLDELKKYSNGDIYFKVSGFYRLSDDLKFAKDVFNKLLSFYKKDRFVFGSDWPHTNYESLINYEKAVKDFDFVVENKSLKEQILSDNAKDLFKIS